MALRNEQSEVQALLCTLFHPLFAGYNQFRLTLELPTRMPTQGKFNSATRHKPTDFLQNSFFGSLAIGTPPTAYDVILDTGSS